MKKIPSVNGIQVDEEIIFVGTKLNILWAINKVTKHVRIIGKIPEEELFIPYSVGAMALCDRKIILAPLNAKNVWSYDLDSNEWHCLELSTEIQNIKEKFFGTVIYNDIVVLLGYKYQGIVIVNIKTDEVLPIEIPITHNINLISKYGFLNWDYIFNGSYIITPVLLKNSVLKINLDNYSVEEIEIGDRNNKYVSIAFDGQNYWLAPREGRNIIKWDGYGQIETYQLPSIYKDDEMYFGSSFFCEGKMYLTSFKGMTYVFDPSDVENGVVLNIGIQFKIPLGCGYLTQDSDGIFRMIGPEIEQYEYIYDEEELERYTENNIDLSKLEMIREGELFALNNFLNVLKKM